MAMFNRFINSNAELRLNDGFSVFFQVFSMDHFNDPKTRRKTHILANLGNITVPDLKINGCCILLPFAVKEFKNSCLLTSCLIGHFFNELIFKKSTIFKKLIPLWKEEFPLSKQMHAVGLLKESLITLCSNTALDIEGPHSETDLVNVSGYLKSQIHIIKSIQEDNANIVSYPEKFDTALPQICVLLVGLNHIVPITNLKQFVNKNREICFLCKKLYKRFINMYVP